MMPLRRVKRRYEIEVCLDLKTLNWVNLIDVSNKYSEINKKFAKQLEQDPEAKISSADENFLIEYECFVELISLFAETCLHRN